MFVVILAATPENRLAKRADFPTIAEADAHVALFLDAYPDAFTAPKPDAPDAHWLLDMVAKTIAIVPPPPPDWDAIDQATIDRLLLESGVMRAFGLTLFEVAKAGKTGDWTFFDGVTNAATFKTLLKGLIR